MSGLYFDLIDVKSEGKTISFDDLLHDIESLKIAVSGNARISKRLKKSILSTLSASFDEITDLRAQVAALRKPRLAKRPR